MALSKQTKLILESALCDRKAAKELAAAIDGGSNPIAASQAAPAAVPATFADEVAARAAVAALQSTVAGLIAKLKAAGLMANP